MDLTRVVATTIAFGGLLLGASSRQGTLSSTALDEPTIPETLVRVEVAAIQSAALKERRRLSVYLPPGYSADGPGYPVLYLPAADGDYLYFATGTARILAQFSGVSKMIVVGLRDINGARDLTPTHYDGGDSSSGGADAFLRHIREEAIPFVEQHFNTGMRGLLWGHSIAGTFAIYALLRQPGLFQDVIVSSPYLIYDGAERFLLSTAPRWLAERGGTPGSLFFTVGDEDNLLPATNHLAEILAKQAHAVRWEYRHLEGEAHRTTLPETLPAGLRWAFSTP